MTGKGHTACGIVSGIAPAALAYLAGGVIPAVAAWLFTISGSTAPDWLECPRTKVIKKGGTERVVTRRLLNHRGLTHTISWWLIGVAYFYLSLTNQSFLGFSPKLDVLISAIGLGFTYGGVIHLLGDLPNRQKMPVFLYKFDGVSLNLFKSGRWEKTMTLICALISAFIAADILGFTKILPTL